MLKYGGPKNKTKVNKETKQKVYKFVGLPHCRN